MCICRADCDVNGLFFLLFVPFSALASVWNTFSFFLYHKTIKITWKLLLFLYFICPDCGKTTFFFFFLLNKRFKVPSLHYLLRYMHVLYWGSTKGEGRFPPGRVPSSSQGPRRAFVGLIRCSRVPWQCFEGILAPFPATRKPFRCRYRALRHSAPLITHQRVFYVSYLWKILCADLEEVREILRVFISPRCRKKEIYFIMSLNDRKKNKVCRLLA